MIFQPEINHHLLIIATFLSLKYFDEVLINFVFTNELCNPTLIFSDNCNCTFEICLSIVVDDITRNLRLKLKTVVEIYNAQLLLKS